VDKPSWFLGPLLIASACSGPSIEPGYWETTVEAESAGSAAKSERHCLDADDGAARLADVLRIAEWSVTDTWQACELAGSTIRGDRISARARCSGRTTVYPQETVTFVTLDGSFAETRLEGRLTVDGEYPEPRSGMMTSRRIGECPNRP
jgi:hypothetical protein